MRKDLFRAGFLAAAIGLTISACGDSPNKSEPTINPTPTATSILEVGPTIEIDTTDWISSTSIMLPYSIEHPSNWGIVNDLTDGLDFVGENLSPEDYPVMVLVTAPKNIDTMQDKIDNFYDLLNEEPENFEEISYPPLPIDINGNPGVIIRYKYLGDRSASIIFENGSNFWQANIVFHPDQVYADVDYAYEEFEATSLAVLDTFTPTSTDPTFNEA